ncbi:MAG: CoA-binding protein [Candidatus Aenigmatarchaeota archaeon]
MKNNGIIDDFLKKENTFAVVGVSRDSDKYGYKVWKDLKNSGYTVYPINPKTSVMEGEKCYSSLEDLPQKPDVVDIAVPPQITEKIVEQCKKIGVEKVWMQPGSESEEAIDFCERNNIDVLHGMCVMRGLK